MRTDKIKKNIAADKSNLSSLISPIENNSQERLLKISDIIPLSLLGNLNYNDVCIRDSLKFPMEAMGQLFKRKQGEEEQHAEPQFIKWHKAAAEQGHAIAQNHLGLLYRNGRGVIKDPHEAIKWFRKGAEQGNTTAQTNLGGFYEDGTGGVKQDFKEALNWYEKAADQGGVTAHYRIGELYENGLGVEQDYKEAISRYVKAANLGNVNAQNYLRKIININNLVPSHGPNDSKVQLLSFEELDIYLKKINYSIEILEGLYKNSAMDDAMGEDPNLQRYLSGMSKYILELYNKCKAVKEFSYVFLKCLHNNIAKSILECPTFCLLEKNNIPSPDGTCNNHFYFPTLPKDFSLRATRYISLGKRERDLSLALYDADSDPYWSFISSENRVSFQERLKRIEIYAQGVLHTLSVPLNKSKYEINREVLINTLKASLNQEDLKVENSLEGLCTLMGSFKNQFDFFGVSSINNYLAELDKMLQASEEVDLRQELMQQKKFVGKFRKYYVLYSAFEQVVEGKKLKDKVTNYIDWLAERNTKKFLEENKWFFETNL